MTKMGMVQFKSTTVSVYFQKSTTVPVLLKLHVTKLRMMNYFVTVIEIILHQNNPLVYCKNIELLYFSSFCGNFVHFSLCIIFVCGLNCYGINIVEKKYRLKYRVFWLKKYWVFRQPVKISKKYSVGLLPTSAYICLHKFSYETFWLAKLQY